MHNRRALRAARVFGSEMPSIAAVTGAKRATAALCMPLCASLGARQRLEVNNPCRVRLFQG